MSVMSPEGGCGGQENGEGRAGHLLLQMRLRGIVRIGGIPLCEMTPQQGMRLRVHGRVRA